MQASAKSYRVSQLKLFDPAMVAPTWERMPHEIRQQTLRLIARLLREHWTNQGHGMPAKEARHE